jgi:signal transduction histidine kinase
MAIDYRAYPVLYVDDDAPNLVAVRYALEDRFSLMTASSGEEGLRILEERDVAVLLCDQRMPGMTGVEVCARARELRPDTIRIIVTAYADMHAAIDAINRGRVTRYLAKPFRDEDLVEVLQTAIELVHIQRTVRDMEVRLLQAGQTHAATTIHAELAHELNNYLSTLLVATQQIGDYARVALDQVEERNADSLPGMLETIHEASIDALAAVEQLQDMVDRLRRGGTSLAEPSARSDVARVVDSTVRIVRAEIQRAALLQVLVEDSPVVAMDKSELGQVVMNLLLNAAQAVEGKHARSTRENPAGPEEPSDAAAFGMASRPSDVISVRVTRGAGEALLTVSDTGPGVSPGQEERIFDPYFTTRDSGNGLGLAVVRSLLHKAGGSIDVEAPPEGGARFVVRLPAVDER